MNDAVVVDQMRAFQGTFDFLNERFFDGKLPNVMLNFCRSIKKCYGFFTIDKRWSQRDNPEASTYEISLNPRTMRLLDAEHIVSTTLHEMVHLWQAEYGKPSRAGYHNREWADEMERVGLMPSNTGQPGGKRTGQKVTHYPIPNGPFAQAFAAMPKELLIPWLCREVEGNGGAKRNANKVKYTCPSCGSNVWGKAGLLIVCGECEEMYIQNQ